jgi:hypothetical protein
MLAFGRTFAGAFQLNDPTSSLPFLPTKIPDFHCENENFTYKYSVFQTWPGHQTILIYQHRDRVSE